MAVENRNVDSSRRKLVLRWARTISNMARIGDWKRTERYALATAGICKAWQLEEKGMKFRQLTKVESK